MKRPRTSVDPNRLHAIVGVAAALILIAVFYVSATALSGLPWQSTYDIEAELPNGSRLVVNDTVRINGVRVGRVAEIEPRPGSSERPPYVVVGLSLEDSVGPLPVDTTVRTRAASLLGASYVALEPGQSSDGIPENGVLPLENASESVAVTDIFEVFDRKTANSIRTILAEAGYGTAGRGPAINATIGNLSQMLGPTTRVLRTLAEPGTQLEALIEETAAFADALAPVHDELASAVSGGGTTFTALADEREALGRTIELLPETEAELTAGLTAARPALRSLAGIAADLRPAARVLPSSIGAFDGALELGVPALGEVPRFSEHAGRFLETLARESRRPSNRGLFRKGIELIDAAAPTVAALEDAQVHCNELSLMFQNLASATVDNTLVSSAGAGEPPQAFAFLNVTHLGAEGEVYQQAEASSNVAINYLPNANRRECEAGNEMHDAVSQVLANPPGFQGTDRPDTDPPREARRLAREAGLLDKPEGHRP